MDNLDVVRDKFLFTPNDVLELVSENDTTFEFIGYVSKISQSRKCGELKDKTLFQFVVSNGFNTAISVISWNAEAVKLENLITETGLVVHFERIKPKTPKSPEFNKGNYKFELTVQKSTSCTILGKYEEPKPKEIASSISLSDGRKYEGKIVNVEGYVKVPFAKVQTQTNKFIVGAITDGIYKLNVFVKPDDFEVKNIRVGTKVKVMGRIQIFPKRAPTLNVTSMREIKIFNLEPIMPFTETILGYRLLP